MTVSSVMQITRSGSSPAVSGLGVRRSLTAALVLAGLLALGSGAAEAADFTNTEAWWNSLDCPEMVAAMTGEKDGSPPHRFCATYADLGATE